MTEEGINEVYRFSRTVPTHVHQKWREKWSKDPNTVDSEKNPKPMIG
jgi:hypothetical protein